MLIFIKHQPTVPPGKAQFHQWHNLLHFCPRTQLHYTHDPHHSLKKLSSWWLKFFWYGRGILVREIHQHKNFGLVLAGNWSTSYLLAWCQISRLYPQWYNICTIFPSYNILLYKDDTPQGAIYHDHLGPVTWKYIDDNTIYIIYRKTKSQDCDDKHDKRHYIIL